MLAEVVKNAGETFTINQRLNTPSIFWIDWGDGTAPAAYRVVSIGHFNYSHTYQQGGTFQVTVYACTDYVTHLDLKKQGVTQLNVSMLSNLISLLLSNQGVSDASRLLQNLVPPDPSFRLPSASTPHPLWRLDLSYNKMAQASLDLSDFTNLEILKLIDNRIANLVVNGLDSLKIFNAQDHYKTLNCTLDLRESHNLEEIRLDGRTGNPVNSQVKILLDSLPKLWYIDVSRANIVDTLDLSKATSLLTCAAYQNQNLSFFFPPAPMYRLPISGTPHPLKSIQLRNNKMAQDSLDLSHFTNLETLDLRDNRMVNLIVNGLDSLKIFNAQDHYKTLNCTLDLRESQNLEEVRLDGRTSSVINSQVKILLDSLPRLWYFDASRSNLVDTLDLSTAKLLLSCAAYRNPSLKCFIPPSTSYRLPISGVPHPLKTLNLYENKMAQSTLDLSHFTNLETLNIRDNRIVNLVVNGLDSLRIFNAETHYKTLNCTLDLRDSHNLEEIRLNGGTNNVVSSQVKILLASVPELWYLHAPRSNLIDTLDLSTVESLTTCILNDNQLDAEATAQSLLNSNLAGNPPTRTVNLTNNSTAVDPITAVSLGTLGWTVTY